MKGCFGAACRLALDLRQLIGFYGEGTRHKGDQVTSPRVTSAEVLPLAGEQVKERGWAGRPGKSGTRQVDSTDGKVASVSFDFGGGGG